MILKWFILNCLALGTLFETIISLINCVFTFPFSRLFFTFSSSGNSFSFLFPVWICPATLPWQILLMSLENFSTFIQYHFLKLGGGSFVFFFFFLLWQGHWLLSTFWELLLSGSFAVTFWIRSCTLLWTKSGVASPLMCWLTSLPMIQSFMESENLIYTSHISTGFSQYTWETQCLKFHFVCSGFVAFLFFVSISLLLQFWSGDH